MVPFRPSGSGSGAASGNAWNGYGTDLKAAPLAAPLTLGVNEPLHNAAEVFKFTLCIQYS